MREIGLGIGHLLADFRRRFARRSGGLAVFLLVGFRHLVLGWPLAQDQVDIIVHAARIFARGAVVDQDKPVGGEFEHMPVVADQYHRAVKPVQGLDQRLTRIDVEVVRRFVEDQQVRRIAGDQRQREPRAFAARQLLDLGRRLVARKAETAKLRADRRLRLALHHPRHMRERGIAAVEFLDLILGEVTDTHLARRRHRARHRGELCRKQACERRLAIAVAAEQRDAIVGIDAQVEPLKHRLVGITDAGKVEGDQRRLQLVGAREIEGQRLILSQCGDRLHLGEQLRARLRLFGGRGARTVARHIILELRALCILRRLRRRQLRGAFGALALECIITARIERDLAALEMQDIVDDIVQQVALMADHDQLPRIGAEEIFEPQRRFEIEVVRRFVEQQQIGFGEE